MADPSRIERLPWSAVCVWAALVCAGFAAWERYDSTPGGLGAEPDRGESVRAGVGWELVLFVHPRCPCGRRSIAELAELSRRGGDRVACRVAVVRPPGAPEGWERGIAWEEATAQPGLTVRCDPDGTEARAAGATTSGHAVLRGADGQTAFRGGLTAGRGRSGAGPGARAVLAIIDGREPASRRCPVFGCALFASGD